MALADEMIATELKVRVSEAGPPRDLWQRIQRDLNRKRRGDRVRQGVGALVLLSLSMVGLLCLAPPGRQLVAAAAGKVIARIGNYTVTYLTPKELQEHEDNLLVPSPVKSTEVAVAKLPEAGIAFPLPTYLGPAPKDRVEILSAQDKNGKLTIESYQIGYPAPIPGTKRGEEIYITYSLTKLPINDGPMEIRLNPDMYPHPIAQEVTIKGATGMALEQFGTWTLMWRDANGEARLTSPLSLEELLKVAESIPTAP